ncbi:hypothetical protein [Shewanella putrefaciens]|uniref:hypothetical protein n=1 Tax=Shewanella putrefaciens TaxID=24 RepID=UPI0018E6EE91|nr:hypothetical protein [Shewanella putrefaciens]
MKIWNFNVQGSQPEPYEVKFLLENNKLSIVCNCRAGVHGKKCKHKMETIRLEIGRGTELSSFLDHYGYTDLLAKIDIIESQINHLRLECDSLEKDLNLKMKI